MSAFVVCPTEEQWKVIQELDLEEGSILLAPEVSEALRQEGFDVDSAGLIEYAFGSDADVWLDVAHTLGHMAVDAIREQCPRRGAT